MRPAILTCFMLATAAQAATPGALFYSVESAADGALNDALSLSEVTHTEHAGALFKCGDEYTYSAPQESGKRDTFRIALRIPKGCTLAAIYHTHPDETDAHLFSGADIETACTLGVPSFIASPRNDARTFTPSTTERSACVRAAESTSRLARMRR